VRVGEDGIAPVRPKKGDRARVIKNENKGAEGEVTAVTEDTAILKLKRGDEELLLKPLEDLARIP
jgi:hypothetical protein